MQLYILISLAAICSAQDACGGCDDEFVRRVHSRDELKKMSRHELDVLLRATEDEKDEAIGLQETRLKEHTKGLEKLRESIQTHIDSLWAAAAAKKSAYLSERDAYEEQSESVRALEAEVQSTAARLTSARQGQTQARSDMHSSLQRLRFCCKGKCMSPKLHEAKRRMKKFENFKITTLDDLTTFQERGDMDIDQYFYEMCRENGGGFPGWPAKGAFLARSKGVPSGEAKLRTIFEIEKLEALIVETMRVTNTGQREYDKAIRVLDKQKASSDQNATHLTVVVGAQSDWLSQREEAQNRTMATVEAMVVRARHVTDTAEAQVAAAASSLSQLTAVLDGCSCAAFSGITTFDNSNFAERTFE